MAGKNAARQKMINMMYLVLTALLALNVSKEVLDGFVRVDEGLEMSENSLTEDMRSNYAGFESYARNVPGRAMEYWEKAQNVRTDADEIIRYIDRIKAKAIAVSEDLPEEQVIASNGLGRDTVLDLAHVNKLDDTDAISHLMIGSEPATPKDGEYTAKQLRDKLQTYQQQLKEMVKDRSPELSASLDKRFDFSDRPDASGVMNNWESLHFYHVPLAAGVTMLSKLQNDVRQAEADVVKYLYRSVSDDAATATELTAAVIPISNYVTVGDVFQADVFLAAYDNKNPPVIELAMGDATIDTVNMEIIGEKRTIEVGHDGKGKLELPAEVVGEQNARGIIRLAGVSGEKRFLFGTEYTVARPALVAAPTLMNVLYRNFENPVELSVPGFSADRIRPSIDNGRITRSGNTYIVKPGNGGKAKITVTAELPDGGTRSFGPVEFRVRNLPAPTAFLGDIPSSKTRIKLNKVKVQRTLLARLPDSHLNVNYDIISAQMVVERNGRAPLIATLRGGSLAGEAAEIIGELRGGERVYFERIKARQRGTSSPVYKLPAISMKVVR